MPGASGSKREHAGSKREHAGSKREQAGASREQAGASGFTQAVEKIYGKVRGVSRSSNLWHLHMIALDKVLAPKASASSSMDTDVDQHLAAGPFGGLVLQTASPRLGTGG